MTKTELVRSMAQMAGVSKAAADRCLEAFITAVMHDVAAGYKITLPGFGTFSTAERAARSARNPRTGEAVEVPARKVPVFKPGVQFKDTVNS